MSEIKLNANFEELDLDVQTDINGGLPFIVGIVLKGLGAVGSYLLLDYLAS